MRIFLPLRLAALVVAALLLAGPARAQTITADWAVPCAIHGGPTTLTTDAQGNTYVSGVFSGTVTIGSTTLIATQTAPGYTGPLDVFLAKLNAQGQYQWAIQLGDGQHALLGMLAADNLGNVYMTGNFGSYSMQVGASGPVLYNSSNDDEGFVARFSGQNGQCQWARRFGSTGTDGGSTLTLNATGELYLTGRTGDGAADLGPYTLPAAPSYSSRDFLAKLSASGTWLWAQQFGTNNSGKINVAKPMLDGLGSLYLTGTFTSPAITLGTTTLNSGQFSSSSWGTDLFVAKLTESGTLRWARQANPGGQHRLSLYQATYDGQGHLCLAGSFDSQNAHLGSFTLTNAGPLVPPPIGPAPPTPNTDRYFSDAFVARYDTAGTWQWATRRGGPNANDYAYLPTLDGTGRLLVLYAYDYNYPVQLASLDYATGAWRTDYQLPTNAFLNRDQLGRLYVYGTFTGPTLSLGGQTVPGAGGTATAGYVARLGQLPLATQPAVPSTIGLQAWPTPGPGTSVWVQGAKPGQAVEVLDMLGRRVGGGTMPASGPLRLSWANVGLAPGVYALRSGLLSCRWVVE